MYKFGFIGTGNMGGALARAVRKTVSGDEILLADKDAASLNKTAWEIGAKAGDNRDVAEKCKYIFLGVKPQVLPHVLAEIAPVLKNRSDRYILVSMAAGVKIESISGAVGHGCPVIRIMPNIAASVGEGMVLVSSGEYTEKSELLEFSDCVQGAGRINEIDEALMDAGCALSGSGPAFAFMFIEALADGGVACGLPRDKALEFAAQTVLGAARLVLEGERHPAELKDAVCSPGGTTIAGVGVLESAGFRAAAIEAVKAAYKRACELGK